MDLWGPSEGTQLYTPIVKGSAEILVGIIVRKAKK